MALFGNHETWKVVYNLTYEQSSNGSVGVAFVEAVDRQDAMCTFMEQYDGQYTTIRSCEKLLG
jgi:hypothetical protein